MEPHRREEFPPCGNPDSAKQRNWRWRGKRCNGRAWRSWPPNRQAILVDLGYVPPVRKRGGWFGDQQRFGGRKAFHLHLMSLIPGRWLTPLWISSSSYHALMEPILVLLPPHGSHPRPLTYALTDYSALHRFSSLYLFPPLFFLIRQTRDILTFFFRFPKSSQLSIRFEKSYDNEQTNLEIPP